MHLQSMKRTKKETKSHEAEVAEPISAEEDYPYGLNINLEKESLEKLGLDIDDFSIGGKVDIICQAEVTSLHESANKNSTNASASLQITNMAMKARPNENPKKLKEVINFIKDEY